jgi:hypothetical protein
VLVEELDEGGVAERDVGTEVGTIGGGEAEFYRETEAVAVERDEAFEVVRVEAKVGKAADHAVKAHHPRAKVKGKPAASECGSLQTGSGGAAISPTTVTIVFG